VLSAVDSLLRTVVDPAFIWLIFGLIVFIQIRRMGLKRARIVAVLFAIFSLVLSSSYALHFASRPLEDFAIKNFKYANAEVRDELPCNEYEGVIALGGVIPNADYDASKGIQLTAGAERVTEPVRLLRLCPNFKLVYTSFGKVIEAGPGESELARDFWIQLGVPKSKIIIENGSTNTYENALETRKLLEGDRKWLLVSSASHLKRAHATFLKAGLNVDPIPVDYIFSKQPPLWSIAPLFTVSGWQGVVHEYIGDLYYSFRDWK